MCASMEGNAIFALLKLGLADERIDRLAQRLLDWQWPDGGWNCDKKRQTQVSSFTETLLPLRALSLYSRSTGHQEASVASERAAEYFLQHRLFKRKSDGSVISGDFLKLFYPYYWHYNILFGLKVLAEAGQIDDPRCREALAILDAKCLPDGGYPAEKKYYHVAEQPLLSSRLGRNEYETDEPLCDCRSALGAQTGNLITVVAIFVRHWDEPTAVRAHQAPPTETELDGP